MTASAAYPEHEKLEKVSAEFNPQALFLDWLEEQGLVIAYRAATPGGGVELRRFGKRKEQLLFDYHGIDVDKWEAEKHQMLQQLQEPNGEAGR
jgi:hypothetical protein